MKAWVQTEDNVIDPCRFDGGPSLKEASEGIGKARKQQMEVCDLYGVPLCSGTMQQYLADTTS